MSITLVIRLGFLEHWIPKGNKKRKKRRTEIEIFKTFRCPGFTGWITVQVATIAIHDNPKLCIPPRDLARLRKVSGDNTYIQECSKSHSFVGNKPLLQQWEKTIAALVRKSRREIAVVTAKVQVTICQKARWPRQEWNDTILNLFHWLRLLRDLSRGHLCDALLWVAARDWVSNPFSTPVARHDTSLHRQCLISSRKYEEWSLASPFFPDLSFGEYHANSSSIEVYTRDKKLPRSQVRHWWVKFILLFFLEGRYSCLIQLMKRRRGKGWSSILITDVVFCLVLLCLEWMRIIS